MRRLTAILCLTLAVLLGSAGEGFALPACPSDQNRYHNDCFGTFTYPDGSTYVGEWKDNKWNGQGTLTFGPSSKGAGDKYVGEFRNNKKHGQGTTTWANGNKYVGEYRDYKLNGQGTYTWTDGGKYVGEWKDNKKHGQGTYTYANGQIQEGIWKDNKFQYAQKVTPPVVARNSPPPSPSADFFEGLTAYRKKNYATALRIWTPLAEQGHAGAQLNLGVMYENGYGVLQDQRTGTKWTRLAAERGHGNFSDTAKLSLGLMYAKGQGVIKDYVYAHMWWNIAASSGNPLIVPDAIKFRDMVYEQMSPADRSKSQDLARECVHKKYKGC